MLSLSDDAVAFAAEKRAPIRIDAPYESKNCCFGVTDCPPVALGAPRQPENYERLTIKGTTVFVPKDFADDHSLVVRTRNFLGFRQLVLDDRKLL